MEAEVDLPTSDGTLPTTYYSSYDPSFSQPQGRSKNWSWDGWSLGFFNATKGVESGHPGW